MPKRYKQVLLTYLRQWQFWLYVAGWAATIVIMDIVPPWFGRAMMFVFLSLAATGPAAVIGHAKQQIADARASLTPGFRTPHVAVAVGLSLVAVVVMPLLSHRSFDTPPLALIASVALLSTAFALIAYFQSLPAVLIGLIAPVLLMFDAARNLGEAMLTGQRSGLAFAALGIAAAAYTAMFYRLAILREGMSEYGRILGDRRDYAWAAAPRRESQSPTSSLLARIQLAAIDKRLRAVRNVFAAGTWQRVRHWRLSGELSGSKWQAALGIAGFITALPLLVPEAREDREGVFAIGAVISVLMPVFVVTATWVSRRRSMGYELTRPIPREQFVREFGLAMASDLAEWWLWLTLGAMVPLFVWGAPVRAIDLLPLVVLSAAEQVLAFGILVWLLRLQAARTPDGAILTSIPFLLIPIILTAMASVRRPPETILAIAAGIAALGAALAYHAYRRWCEADLA